MPSPIHQKNAFKANRIFTDRDEARALFTEQYGRAQKRNEYRILNYSGAGGQGKSALCGQFEEQLKKLQGQKNNLLAWAKVDFEDAGKHRPTDALLALRLQLAHNGGMPFPAFDTAFARYFELTQAGRDLTKIHPDLFCKPSDILLGQAKFAGAVSHIPLLEILVSGGEKLEHKLYMDDWNRRRGDHLMRGLYGYATHELEAKLPVYLGADVEDWLLEEDGRRVVLLYDTYEALWRDRTDKTDPLIDNWVRSVVAETPAVLHVILGRDQLDWDKHEETWRTAIFRFTLDGLFDADAEAYLQAVPVEEDDIRSRIVEGAKGIPFYLSLQVDQYEDARRCGKALDAREYGGTGPEILRRFANYLPDTLRRAMVVAACPRRLDETLFLDLCGKFLGGIAAVSFADLTSYSFWSEKDGQHYLHAMMRDYLQDDTRKNEPVLYRQIHQYLFEYHDAKLQRLESASDISREHILAFSEGAYHLEQIDRNEIPRWVNKYAELFHAAAERGMLEALLEKSLAIQREVGDKQGEGETLNDISQIFQARGDFDTALDYLEKSLAIRRESGDKSGEGTTLNNMGKIALARSDHDVALDYFEKSLAIAQETGDKQVEGATLNNISQFHALRGDHAKALDYLEQALAIQRETGNKQGEGITLNNMAGVARACRDYATALGHLEKALAIQQEIGDKHGEGATLNNMAGVAHARDDYDTMLDHLEKSLAICCETGDKSGEGAALNNISQVHAARGDFDTALDYLEKSLAIQQEIGDKRSEGATLGNISQVHDARGNADTALDYLKQALAIQQGIGDKRGEGAAFSNMGSNALARGDFAAALGHLEKALAIYEEIGDSEGTCTALFNMGYIHWNDENHDQAMLVWANSCAIAKRIELANVLDALKNLAEKLDMPGGLDGWEKIVWAGQAGDAKAAPGKDPTVFPKSLSGQSSPPVD